MIPHSKIYLLAWVELKSSRSELGPQYLKYMQQYDKSLRKDFALFGEILRYSVNSLSSIASLGNKALDIKEGKRVHLIPVSIA